MFWICNSEKTETLKPFSIFERIIEYRGKKLILRMMTLIITMGLALLNLSSCSKSVRLAEWQIFANSRTEEISFKQDRLGLVFQDVKLLIKNANQTIALTDWEIVKRENILIINTRTPIETTWDFVILDDGIDVNCTETGAFLAGIAPAGENRIPARTVEQDNGIMYTQMGFVSALNINHLFDIKTDIMIRFSKGSRLTRNCSNYSKMDIEIPVDKDLEIILVKNYYTDVIGLAKYQVTDFKPVYKPIPENFKTAPTGWSTWYCYYMAPTEEDMVLETDALAEKLKPYGLEYVQLDACFTRGEEANWLEWTKELFPRGGKWWFQYIANRGLKPGLWINLYGDNYVKPSMADKYPEDFYLRDQNGKLSGACCTADTTVVRLDYTNPAVIKKHLKPLFRTLVNEWGLRYLKSAGWGTWMDYFEENRQNAFNPEMDSREAYRSAQAAVRKILGNDNYIVGCAMHEIGIGFDYYDGSRTGGDDFASWYGKEHWSEGMQTFFKSLFGAAYLNGICWWSDPDAVMVRDPLTMEEGKTIVTTASLSGQAYIISDFIAEFSKERKQQFISSKYKADWSEKYPDLVFGLQDNKIELYQQTMPAMPIRAMDLYPFRVEPRCCPNPDEYPRALDLKINSASGVYDVVALYNWDDTKMKKHLNLVSDLGLGGESEYLVFEYWDRKILGTITEDLSISIPAHGTKALIIKKSTDRPQFLAASRHLTSAFSIKNVKWNLSKNLLSGVSETVPGDSYTVYVHVPATWSVNQIKSDCKDFQYVMTNDNLLEISFAGVKNLVRWDISFIKNSDK